MKIIILCGGIGSRMNDYSMPKPLNMVYGKPAIFYVLKNIPEEVKELYFIYGDHLKEYNFEEIIINLFKKKRCFFSCVKYLTRGPVETAFIGLQQFNINENENIVFLDNDNMYTFPEGFFEEKAYNFLGSSIDNTNSSQYSFLKHKNDIIYDIVEKERISDNYICGVYGFQNKEVFLKSSHEVLRISKKLKRNEIYMSDLFRYLIETSCLLINIHFVNQGNHIGSLQELKKTLSNIQTPKLRICFDLDNTLVTYPTTPGDYNSVRPIEKMISLARRLQLDGHIIIIYTARRMETHKYNIGSVMKDIGKITFETLEKFNIPFDEIIFGKPLADIYIDDRAVNPYMSDLAFMGLFEKLESNEIVNKLPNNKYNTMTLVGNKIIKRGPLNTMRGEYHVYFEIQKFDTIKEYFPKFFYYEAGESESLLEIEYIKGIPLFFLFRHNLIFNDMILDLINILEQFHSIKAPMEISTDIFKKNYIEKLEKRFQNEEDYPFEDRNIIQKKTLDLLKRYIESGNMKLVPFIHGDFWFSNIIYTFDRKYKCFDMKGLVDDIATTNGDPLYDYAKMYQSLLGFDLVMWDNLENYNETMKSCRLFFESELEKRGICLEYLRSITIGLIMGSLHAVDLERKKKIWKFVKDLLEVC